MIHYLFWLLSFLLTRLLVSFRVQGEPSQDVNLIICNHVSSIDWLFIKSIYKQPVYFVADARFWAWPWMAKALDLVGCIPISGSPGTLRRALKRIDQHLDAGDLVVIFPEGKLTTTGKLQAFQPGLSKIISKHPLIKIQVLYLQGLYTTWWSKQHGQFFYHKVPNLNRPQVTLHIKHVFHSILFKIAYKDYGLSYLNNYLHHTEDKLDRKL